MRGRQIENIAYAGLRGDLFEVCIDFIHRWRNKGEPDIIGIFPAVVVGDTRIAVYDFGKLVDLIFGYFCGAQRADESKLFRFEVAADAANNTVCFRREIRFKTSSSDNPKLLPIVR